MECFCQICPVHKGLYARVLTAEALVYRAVLDGRLRIDAEGRVWRGLKRAESERGPYLRVRSHVNGKLRNTQAHRLVWHHFNGPIPDGLQVNHINGNGFDNRPSNLEVLTPSQNTRHRYHVLERGQLSDTDRAKGRKKIREFKLGLQRSYIDEHDGNPQYAQQELVLMQLPLF